MADGLQGGHRPEGHVPGQLHQTHVDEQPSHDRLLTRELKGHQLPYTRQTRQHSELYTLYAERNKKGGAAS